MKLRTTFLLVLILLFGACGGIDDDKRVVQIQSDFEQNKISAEDANSIVCKPLRLGIEVKRNFWVLFYDENYLFGGKGFGSQFCPNEADEIPSFYVHSKKYDHWLVVDSISTKNGIFGCENELTKEEQRKLMRSMVPLCQSHLKRQKFCKIPLSTGSSISFPENIFYSQVGNEYVLEFYNSWEIENVKTIIRLNKKALDFEFEKIFKK